MKVVGAGIVLVLMVLGLLPFALIARLCASQTDALPIHLVLDMDKQAKFKVQRANALFADDRSMRPEIAHTLALEDMYLTGETLNDRMGTRPIMLAGDKTQVTLADATTYAAVMLGRVRPANMTDAQFAQASIAAPKSEAEIAGDTTYYVRRIPAVFTVSEDFLRRGQERFTINCSPCHGESGFGDGPIAVRGASLRRIPDGVNGWADPQNLHEAKILLRPDGHIFNTITNGIRSMSAYDKQVSVPDRWAIVAYIRALQRSQDARPGDMPAR